MTVGELQDLLSGFPVDLLVVISKDEEGNGFSLLDGYGECHYDEDSEEVTFPEDDDGYEDIDDEEYEDIDDEAPFEVNAVCLWM